MDDRDALLPNHVAAGGDGTATLWGEAAAVLSGLIGGGRYGLKIRVPHAFGECARQRPGGMIVYSFNFSSMLVLLRYLGKVMTFLFGSHLSFRDKLKAIAKLAAEHSSNLAAFACLYKVGRGVLLSGIACTQFHFLCWDLHLNVGAPTFYSQLTLASLKVLSQRIKQHGCSGVHPGVIRRLSASILSLLGRR